MSHMPPTMPPTPHRQMQPAPQRPNLTPEERRRTLIRSIWFLVGGSFLSLLGSIFVLSPFPLFLFLFVFALMGIGLNILAMVRNAQGKGPWVLYVAAGFGILFTAYLMLSGLVMVVSPQGQEYRQCITQALTDADQQKCRDTLNDSVGTGVSVSVTDSTP